MIGFRIPGIVATVGRFARLTALPWRTSATHEAERCVPLPSSPECRTPARDFDERVPSDFGDHVYKRQTALIRHAQRNRGQWSVAVVHRRVDARNGSSARTGPTCPYVSMKEFPVHLLGDPETIELKSAELDVLLTKDDGLTMESTGAKELPGTKGREELEQYHDGHHIASALAWVLSEVLSSSKLRGNAVENHAGTTITIEENSELSVVARFHEWAHSLGSCIGPPQYCGLGAA